MKKFGFCLVFKGAPGAHEHLVHLVHLSAFPNPRRCPLPASLEGVGGGPRRTNRAGQSPVPGTDPPERNRRAKSRTADPPKVTPQVPRGARTGRRDRTPLEHPGPSLWAEPGKAGMKQGGGQAELGPRRLPRTLPAGAGGAGPETALGGAPAAPPRPGRYPGGGPADCP